MLDLRDITFDVSVDVSRDIKMVIPSAFRLELDAAVALLQETNPHEIYWEERDFAYHSVS